MKKGAVEEKNKNDSSSKVILKKGTSKSKKSLSAGANRESKSLENKNREAITKKTDKEKLSNRKRKESNNKKSTLKKSAVVDEVVNVEKGKRLNNKVNNKTDGMKNNVTNSAINNVMNCSKDKKSDLKSKKSFIFLRRVDKKDSKAVQNYKKRKKKKDKAKKYFNGKFSLDILDILIVVVITAIVSCVFTGVILNYQYKKNSHYLSNEIIADENVQSFLNLYSEILDNYYEDVDANKMMKAAIQGMLSFLGDSYSIYLSENDSDSLSETLDGSYEGIGVLLKGNVVYDVYKNSPADKAGIKVGDEIIKINGEPINMNNYNTISSLVDMENENDIVVSRNDKEVSFKVKVSTVSVPSTTSNLINNKSTMVGYVSLNAFSSMSFEDFQQSLGDLEEQGMDSLIIDLRDNTGGYLNAANNIASLFIEKGEIIYSLESKDQVTDYKDETNDKRDYKIVILVNEKTASAAEILTAALHDSYGAIVVGNTTYGKGKVQTMKHYEESIVKYTSAKWLRPNGECIDQVGIKPDYEINNVYEGTTVYDRQLDKALELLR